MNLIIDVLIISGSVLGLFLSLSIGTISFFRSKANKYLSVSIFLLTIIMFFGWLNAATGFLNMLRAIMWELLVPITILSYFLIHLQHPFFKSRFYKLLYLPFILSLVIDIFLELDFSMNLYKLPFTRDSLLVRVIFGVDEWLALLINVFFMLWTLILIKKSLIDKVIKSWLIRFNLLLLGVISLWLMQELGELFFLNSFSAQIIWGLISIIFWFVLYFGVFKLQIAIEVKEIRKILEHSYKDQKSLSRDTNLTEGKSKYTLQLIQLMEQDKWYKNPMLSRLDLAAKLNISEGHLSKTINDELGKSIIQLINEYRINEAKKLLQSQYFVKYSIEAIGMESGFKSKSVFYDVFKSIAGMSPGESRKHYKTS